MIRTRHVPQLLRSRREETPPVAELRPRRPYPNGWFAVAFAEELSPGRVLRRRLMGEDVVVYRTRSGVVRAVGPYCPHLGAHLGHGGWIEGEDIVCPFHHFAFGVDGTCVRTGYGTRPPAARLVRHEVREVNGAILVWHHADGAPPSWEVAERPTDGYPSPFRHVTTIVDHPQDIVENAIDIGHIGPVHGYRNVRVRRPFTPTGPSFAIDATGERMFPLAGPVEIVFDIVVHGLGHIWVEATIPRLGSAAQFQAMATPLDPRRVQLRFSVALRVGSDPSQAHARLVSRVLTNVLSPAFRRDLTRDFPIWEHKVYIAQPRLAKGDGPLPAFRRWTEQFYSQTATNGGEPALALSADR
jgi:phenylpropionate dioxygenase-like ring-hydroxylating dioxygenase large terminal subunit